MKLYCKYIKIHFKSAMQYKLSFIMAFTSQILVLFSYYFTILCLFDKFSNVKGFTLYEVLFSYGIIQFGTATCESFFRGIDHFDRYILEGTFDRLLLRPRNTLLQVFCEDIDFIKFSKLLQGIIIIIIALLKLDIEWNIYRVITFICMLISSVVIFLGLFILAASYCFVTVKGLEVRNIFTDGFKHIAQYPIGIFKKGFVLFLTYVIPFGFVNYYPLLYFLGRTDNKLLSISPLITIVYLIPIIMIFNRGVRKYTSVGS